ncbi:MAG: hypothetical protein JSS83_08595 [Cyanobacteria bacterium SZAS LIN-3]|nr:hypothetical protein [Cyanobacteria bacterium SZAS LIN-3]
MRERRILICYADTGGGHQTAAEAVRDALEELDARDKIDNPECAKTTIFVETVVEETNAVNALFVGFYNYLLRHHQDWMKYYTAFIETFKPNETYFGYLMCKPYLQTVYERMKPSVVVSVHPMVNHYMDRARYDAGRQKTTKLVIVLTDPNGNLWSGWACKRADLLIAPNDLACNQLIKMGIDASRIKTIGMPIEPEFVQPPEIPRERFLTELGFDPSKPTILLSGGWAGGGPLTDIYETLKEVKREIQVIVLCGNNKVLRDRMRRHTTGSPIPTVVMGYKDSLSDIFAAGDLLVTKAGGLTTYEAVARRLPMAINLLTEPMPQEMGTVDILIGAGLAKPVHRNEDIIAIVENLEIESDRQNRPLPSEHSLNRVDAVYDIARAILDIDAGSN